MLCALKKAFQLCSFSILRDRVCVNICIVEKVNERIVTQNTCMYVIDDIRHLAPDVSHQAYMIALFTILGVVVVVPFIF